MTYKTIRKNATKTIQSYLDQAVGIIAKTSSMQIDDSYDSSERLVSAADVMAWLECPDNYRTARVLLEDDKILSVGGPYHFCDSFDVYLDQSEFDARMDWKKVPAKVEAAPIAPAALPSNVVSLCEYRKRMAG